MIGYPPWWGDRPKGRVSSSVSQGNSSSQAKGAMHSANVALTASDQVGFSGLSEDQWKTLVQMLGERKQGDNDQKLTGISNFSSWIIDTGASNHMTGSVDFLTEVSLMNPMFIKLPDGRITVATQQGSVRLDSSLTLTNVFFVDGLSCHLISVSQLTRSIGCVFQISDKICVIQDRITRMLIGAAEQIRGLYFFRGVEVAATVYQTEECSASLWHRRLGHPASHAVDLLDFSHSFKGVSVDNKACEVCLRAKQTRLSFPISSNKTNGVFQLVHCDLWSPYRTPALCGSKYF